MLFVNKSYICLKLNTVLWTIRYSTWKTIQNQYYLTSFKFNSILQFVCKSVQVNYRYGMRLKTNYHSGN